MSDLLGTDTTTSEVPTPEGTDFLSTPTAGEGTTAPPVADSSTSQPPPPTAESASSSAALPDKSLLPDALKAAGLDEGSINDYMALLDVKGENGMLLGKYKDVGALVEGFKNLSKKVTEKQAGKAPDEYSEESLNGIEFSEEQLKVFKDSGFDDKAVKVITEMISGSFIPQTQQLMQDNAELHLRASLGFTPEDESYSTYINGLAQWASENVPEDALKVLRTSPQGILSLVNMRKSKISDGNTTSLSAVQQSGESVHDQLLTEMKENFDKYLNDPIYQKNLNDRMEKAAA